MTSLRELALLPPLPAPAVMVFGSVSGIAQSSLAATDDATERSAILL